jgi:membrane associated rhomboid family serine protease
MLPIGDDPRTGRGPALPAYFFATTRVSALVLLGFWFLLQLFNGLAAISEGTAQTGGVAVWAHIGGFVVGALVGLLLRGGLGVSQRAYGR